MTNSTALTITNVVIFDATGKPPYRGCVVMHAVQGIRTSFVTLVGAAYGDDRTIGRFR